MTEIKSSPETIRAYMYGGVVRSGAAPAINHATEAAEAAQYGKYEIAAYHASMALAEAAAAQVAATLAQTEQLRIGNLLAYVAVVDGQFRAAEADAGLWNMDAWEASNKRREAAQILVLEGLGL